MKNKIRIFVTLVAALICLGSFSVTAYANGGEERYYIEPEPTESVAPEESPDVTGGYEPEPLTPDGNSTLVDDIEGETAEDKQFITVQTKDGNYFYIVIDRASDTNNVYFLNLVDEADLLALMEIEDIPSQTAMVANTIPEPEKTTEPADANTQQEDENGGGGLVILLVVVLLGGGGALVYFKLIKPKQNVKGGVDLENYDFDEDDEDEYSAEEQEDGK